MDYTKLAKEAYKMYAALRDEKFDAQQAYGIVKVCVRDYPIFREMIEKEQSPEEAIGYVYFVNGNKEPIYKVIEVTMDTIEVHTKDDAYRRYAYEEYQRYSFSSATKYLYSKFISKEWQTICTIDRIELF